MSNKKKLSSVPHSTDEIWEKMVGMTDANKLKLLEISGIDIDHIHDMEDNDEYIFMPLQLMVKGNGDSIQRRQLMIIYSEKKIITIQDNDNFPPFEAVKKYIPRHPEALKNSRYMLSVILHVLNEQASKNIASIGADLEDSSDDITAVTGSLNTGREVGIADISDTMIDLNEKEELISRCLESQLALARAARFLDGEVSEQRDRELQSLVKSLRDDISSVKEHAAYEHEKIRYLQSAILASLNVKQNQIVKVFTIITAVFLPPTLIASLYGMNFSVMPELSWEHGFPFTILLTLITSILPLLYIKYRGWLR